jgi:hypothetical protein
MTDKLPSPGLQESDELLSELLEEVQRWEGTLTGGTKLGSGAAAVTNLKDSKVSLGNPKDKLTLLTEATFQETGTELSSIYRQQMQDQYDFYYLTLRVELRPKPTAQFWRLICELDFGPKGEQEPILQSVFPNEKWRSVLSVGVGMDIGLNGNLDWTAGVDTSALTAVLEQVPGEIKGEITNKNEFKAFVAMPAYKYEFGLFEILTTGVGSTAYWRIQDEALKKTGMIEFATVFKVPKAVQELELVGKAWVEPDVNWLFADVRDVAGELSDRFKQLFRNKEEAASRFARWDAERWQLQLPKAKTD